MPGPAFFCLIFSIDFGTFSCKLYHIAVHKWDRCYVSFQIRSNDGTSTKYAVFAASAGRALAALARLERRGVAGCIVVDASGKVVDRQIMIALAEREKPETGLRIDMDDAGIIGSENGLVVEVTGRR